MKASLRIVSISLLLAFAFVINANGQDSSFTKVGNGIRISLLTCGPGLDLYSGFGHSGIRVMDSNRRKDIVYNYGSFDFRDPDFYSKFTRGKLLYYVSKEVFFDSVKLRNGDYRRYDFLRTYELEKRSVYEQVLDLTDDQESRVVSYLDSNAQEKNKYYKYDFLHDNCSTRQLMLFQQILGEQFKIGTAQESGTKTFRDFTNHYLRNNHWTRTGINLLLSTPVDKKMSNEQAMFLPDYLKKGFRDATLNGKPIVSQTIEILPGKLDFSPKPNTARMTLWLFGFIALFIWLKARDKMIYFDTFFFLIIGLLGSFMLFMWFGTDHQACSWNRNLFWALPTHFIFAFLIPRKHKWIQPYARIAFYILLISLAWNIWAAQSYIIEITPIVILLIWRLNHYRRDPEKNKMYANVRSMFSQFQQTKGTR